MIVGLAKGEKYGSVRGYFDDGIRVEATGVLPYAFAELSAVSELGKYSEVVYVDTTDLVTVDTKKRVVQFGCNSPNSVARVRDRLLRQGYRVYEADIPYVRRLYIDGVLKVGYSKDNVLYVDIEVDDSQGFPSEPGKYKILSIACVDSKGRERWFYWDDYNNEKEMLGDFWTWAVSNGYSVLAGWNISEFDIKHLVERSKFYKLRKIYEYFGAVDLILEYKNEVKGLGSYTLDEVAKYEGLGGKVVREKRVSEMSRDELYEYNMQDARLVYEIDKKYGFTELRLELANTVNLQLDMLSPLQIGDTLVLRRLRELGYVAPCGERYQKKGYQGAFVLEPVMGMHRNVAVFDFASLYPSIIVNENIDIADFKGEVLPYIERQFLELRQEYKKKYKETGDVQYNVKQSVYKVLANAMYGLLGIEYFRFFDEKKAAMITAKGREQIMRVKSIFENEFGLEVVYGDTDSVFVRLDGGSDNVEELARALEEMVNEKIAPYKIKLEYILDPVVFIGEGGKAVKKRYVGVVKGDGKWVVRGIELRRSDWCELAKEVQKKVLEMVFEGKTKKEVLEYLRQVKDDMRAGRYDDKLIISKSITKDLSKYKANQPHVRAYRRALEKGYKPIGKVQYVWVKGGDVEPVINGKWNGQIDYDWYWDHQIYPPARRIIASVFSSKHRKLFDN